MVRCLSLASVVCVLGLVMLTSPWSGGAHASTPPARAAAASYPLHTSGRWIVDASGRRVKLAAVNWYGAESPEYVVGGLDDRSLNAIVGLIKAHGFNAVRIPFSNQLWETNPVVKREYLRANRGLVGEHARQILDQVIDKLGKAGLMVILDDHTTNAGWCCDKDDGNGLWYGKKNWGHGSFTESEWISDWVQIARHYAADPWVVGAELRNELRADAGGTPYWANNVQPVDCTGTTYRNDWPMAATCAGNAVLAANPNLLVIVDGLNFSTDLADVTANSIVLYPADKLVYAAHNYVNEDDGLTNSGKGSYSAFKQRLDSEWGFISTQGIAPVWVSEFGTCLQRCGTKNRWRNDMYFAYIRRYLGDANLDWAYWALNGTQSKGKDLKTVRKHGKVEHYGLLNPTWTGPSNAGALADIEQLRAPSTTCTFSQLCSSASLEQTPDGQHTVSLPAGEGLYVVCYRAGPSYEGDRWWEYVNWTSSHKWSYAGYLPDAQINTYHANPAFYWAACPPGLSAPRHHPQRVSQRQARDHEKQPSR